MKFGKTVVLLLCLSSILVSITSKVLLNKSNKATEKAATKTTSKTATENKNKIVIMAEAYNIEGMPASIAVTTADVKFPNANEQYEDYTNPQMVNHLMEDVGRPLPGPIEPIGEVPTIHDYYDGSMHLNKVKIDCKIYTSKSDCVSTSFCGWCGANGGCVLGNSAGPEKPCITGSFIYGKPVPNYQPMVRKINENVGGVSQHLISSIQ